MALEYSRGVLKVCVAQICQHLGWHAIQSTPLEVIADIMGRYMSEVASNTHRYCEQFGRTEPNLDDVAMAFNHMGIELSDLEHYYVQIESVPFAKDVVKFPQQKESDLLFPNPRSREILEKRPEHVPEYLPYMFPGMDEELDSEGQPIKSTMKDSESVTSAVDSPLVEVCNSPISTTNTTTEKLEKISTPDNTTFKRIRSINNISLPEEAGPSTYRPTVVLGPDGRPSCKHSEGRLPTSGTAPLALKQILTTPSGLTEHEEIDDDIFNITANVHSSDDVAKKSTEEGKGPSKESTKLGKQFSSQKLKMAKRIAKNSGKISKLKFVSKSGVAKDVLSKYKIKNSTHNIANARKRITEPEEKTIEPTSDNDEGNEGYDHEDMMEEDENNEDFMSTGSEVSIQSTSGQSEGQKKSRNRALDPKNKTKKLMEEKAERTTPVELRVFDFTASPDRNESEAVKPLRTPLSPDKKLTEQKSVSKGRVAKVLPQKEPVLFEADIPTYRATVKTTMDRKKVTKELPVSVASSKSKTSAKESPKTGKMRKPRKEASPPETLERTLKQNKNENQQNTKDKDRNDYFKQRNSKPDKKEKQKVRDRKRHRDSSRNLLEPDPSGLQVPKIKLIFSGHELSVESPVGSPAQTKGDHPRIVFKTMKPQSEETKTTKQQNETTLSPSSRTPSASKKLKMDDESPKKLSPNKLLDKTVKDLRGRIEDSGRQSVQRTPSPPSLTRHKSLSPPLLSKQLDVKNKITRDSGNSAEDSVQKSDAKRTNQKSDREDGLKTPKTTPEKTEDGSSLSPTKRKPGRPPKHKPVAVSDPPISQPELGEKDDTAKEEVAVETPSISETSRLPPRKTKDLPPLPPSSVSKPLERAVFVETVDTYVEETDESGERVWICPGCKEPDDGSPMIGCDVCDDWYHWPCVRITKEPSDDQWYCPKCVGLPMPSPILSQKAGRGKSRGRGRGKRRKSKI